METLTCCSSGGVLHVLEELGRRGLQTVGDIVYEDVINVDQLVRAADAGLEEIEQGAALFFGDILIGVAQDDRKDRAVHMEGQAAAQQLFKGERELIQQLVAEQVTVLLVERAEVFDVDRKDLKGLFARDAVVDLGEKAVAVVELGQRMHALALSLEGQKEHSVHHREQEAVQHDLGVETLEDDTERDGWEDLHQDAAHRAAGVLTVAEVTDEDEHHLRQRDEIAERVQRTAAVRAVCIKVEQPSRPQVEEHDRGVDGEEHRQTDAGVPHTVARMGVLQNFREQIERDARGGDDVHEEVHRVGQHIVPQRYIGGRHQPAGPQVGRSRQRVQQQTGDKKFAGARHIADIGFAVKKEHEKDQDQAQRKEIAYKNHMSSPFPQGAASELSRKITDYLLLYILRRNV